MVNKQMMNMKKTFMLLFVAILPLLASAQKEEVKVTVVEEESAHVKK